MAVDIVCCGVGAGATYVYDGGSSSAFLVRASTAGGDMNEMKPMLLLDCGGGAIRAVHQYAGSLPDNVYISHNHTDHAGELPVMLAVESQRGHRMQLLAEPAVLNTLLTHRLHELQSTGRPLSDFGCFTGCPAGQLYDLGDGLSLLPLKSRHAERCFGLLLYWHGQPVLGWSADSGYDAALYSALSVAPVLLLDCRAKGNSEHAGFAQLAAAASSGLFRSSKVFAYGYGQQQEAPQPDMYPGLYAVTPGTVIQLTPRPQNPASEAAFQQQQPGASNSTAAVAAAAAAAAAAEATAAASAAAAATAAASAAAAATAAAMAAARHDPMDVPMQDSEDAAAQGPASNGLGGLNNNVQGGSFVYGTMKGFKEADARTACQRQPSWPPAAAAAAAAAAAQQHMVDLDADSQDEMQRGGRIMHASIAGSAAAAAAGRGAVQGCIIAGYPGALPQHQSQQHQQQQQQRHRLQGRIDSRQQQQMAHSGMYRSEQLQLQQQQQQRGAVGAVVMGRRHGLSTTTSTSSSTAV